MLIGYVSDERYVALAGAHLAFERDGECHAIVESAADGAVRADLAPGTYDVALQRDGYGGKRTTVTIEEGGAPHQFRLLSTDLLGYAWPKWTTAGSEVEYRIHSHEETRVSLWRYGEEKEFVRLIDWHGEHGPEEQRQVVPDGDFTKTGVAWRDKLPGAFGFYETDRIEAPERSGLYFFHLEGKESGGFFSFPLVVAPAEPGGPLAVLCSTMTWNAYNEFGGRSNYINPEGLPPRPTVHGLTDLPRFREVEVSQTVWGHENHEYEPLSFERPTRFNHVRRDEAATDPIRGRYEAYGAPAEWRLLAWLEREGYAYDLYAENQLHDGTLDLDAYDAAISHTHPEYWSHRMYRKVKDWVDERGGGFAYLGGNGLAAEVEVVDEHRMRYLTRYPPEDGPWESRIHMTAEPSSELIGTATATEGLMTAAPYEVLDADHWIFEGTGLEDGDTFGEESLQERTAGGASGCETDVLSPHAPEEFDHLARGQNPVDAGADMLYYETGSGGAVFSVGSITYPAALLIDDDVARITGNALDRFVG